MLEQSSGLLSLPPEVINGLAKCYLNARDTLSLAQTCRILFFANQARNPGLVDLAKHKKQQSKNLLYSIQNPHRFRFQDDSLLFYALEARKLSSGIRIF
jgi:hypothetical protein